MFSGKYLTEAIIKLFQRKETLFERNLKASKNGKLDDKVNASDLLTGLVELN